MSPPILDRLLSEIVDARSSTSIADPVEFASVKLGVAARRWLLLIGEFPRFWTLRRGAGEGEKVAIVVEERLDDGNQ